MNCPECGADLSKCVVGYYGSDLNKLVDEKCTRLMTANNIDLILHKKSHKAVRIIESKHSNEGMKKGQRDLLKLLSNISLIETGKESVTFETFIVYGDYPFDTARIVRFIDNKELTVDYNELIAFLNFEMTFDYLYDAKNIPF